jgi:hypothetical protein
MGATPAATAARSYDGTRGPNPDQSGSGKRRLAASDRGPDPDWTGVALSEPSGAKDSPGFGSFRGRNGGGTRVQAGRCRIHDHAGSPSAEPAREALPSIRQFRGAVSLIPSISLVRLGKPKPDGGDLATFPQPLWRSFESTW